jgi:hypothetical protein
MKYLMVVVLLLQGCSFLSVAEDRVANNVGKIITDACKQDKVLVDRFVTMVNVKSAPNSVAVECK